jgi:hypothetical protein
MKLGRFAPEFDGALGVGAAQRHYVRAPRALPHQLGDSIGDSVSGLQENSVGVMRVLARDARLPVADQRRDRQLAVTEIGGDRREGMAQNVRRYVRGERCARAVRLATRKV